MYGAEIAWMNAAAMEVSEVVSALDGALEEGASVNPEENGRVILSSLEMHPVTGRQYIHWQQCSGKGSQKSEHGKPDPTGSLQTSLMTGLKINGKNISAPPRSAVMVAEVWFTYSPLFGTLFMKPITIHEQAAIIVRDDRNVGTGITGSNKKIKC